MPRCEVRGPNRDRCGDSCRRFPQACSPWCPFAERRLLAVRKMQALSACEWSSATFASPCTSYPPQAVVRVGCSLSNKVGGSGSQKATACCGDRSWISMLWWLTAAYAGFSRSRSTLGTSSTAVHTSTTWAAMARPTSPRSAPYEDSPLHAAYCCAFPRLASRTHTTEATSSSARTAFSTSPSETVAFQSRLKTRTHCLARSSDSVPGQANAKPEIVAWGLRNPWRFSFTRDGSALVIGDVGANRREEIDVVRRRLFGRANLGWPWFEGTVRRSRPEPDGRSVLVKPFVEYGHARKRCYSVVGGIVYRGALFPGPPRSLHLR